MKNSIFLLFSLTFLFFGCKKENENYIEKIEYFESSDAPGPDKIEFNLNVSDEIYNLMHEDSLTRQIFVINKSERIDYPAHFFCIEKLKNNKVKYIFFTPYFLGGKSKIKHYSENQLNEYFNNSKELKLILHFNKHVFEFKNK
ncbi:hypothetical protein [Flavobacterium sp. UBA7663]|uniref:hypothetical protein n=1 Tax=Flavobacterium sp. UBA7663 TaxID=1946557 RepID=UPI0025B95445|nr:hypothetical protein [Flavobacterium sp. UBA7663]